LLITAMTTQHNGIRALDSNLQLRALLRIAWQSRVFLGMHRLAHLGAYVTSRSGQSYGTRVLRVQPDRASETGSRNCSTAQVSG
jgi:hypothetical protein